MDLNISQWRSLKTRVTLFTLAIFVISICSLALYVSRSLREDMERQLGEQQFSTVSFVAAEINEGLALRIKTLEKVALSIDQSLLGNPAALQQMLERQVFVDFFNAGVVAVTADGTAVAEVVTLISQTLAAAPAPTRTSRLPEATTPHSAKLWVKPRLAGAAQAGRVNSSFSMATSCENARAERKVRPTSARDP